MERSPKTKGPEKMKLKDTMVVWTPVAKDNLYPELSGRAAITTQPERLESQRHPCSAGICDLEWIETDHAGRLTLLEEIASRMVYLHALEEHYVRDVLAGIDDIDTLALSISPQLAGI